MVFSSVTFLLFFFPVFLILYFLTPVKYRNTTFLLASLAFYSWGAPKFVFILVGTTILDYYIVKYLDRTAKPVTKKLLLALSLTITIGLLAFFKYANFFVENINEVLGWFGFTDIRWTKILLPIGISFFSFQKLTYVIDVYNKIHKPFKNPFDYLLFIVMFPQLIAGPIIWFHEIVDQIASRHHNLEKIFEGAVRFIVGLSKKVLIANVLSRYADSIFDSDILSIDSFEAWLATFAYTFQIYFDFSGYSDMAIGMGKIMGFNFPENFNNPYISQNISEFWRRWHMTLGRWMKNYLYIPLGGNRVKTEARLYFNLIFVFFVSGLWHGAAWNFVIWGIYHGVFLIMDRIFLIKVLQKAGRYVSVLFTFLVTILGWVIFRLENLNDIVVFYKKMFSFKISSLVISDLHDIVIMLVIAFIFSFITLFKFGLKIEEYVFYKPYSEKVKFVLFICCLILLVLSLGSITGSKFNPFIYFRF